MLKGEKKYLKEEKAVLSSTPPCCGERGRRRRAPLYDRRVDPAEKENVIPEKKKERGERFFPSPFLFRQPLLEGREGKKNRNPCYPKLI